MSGINKMIMVGRVGQDPEMKSVGQGGTVTTISVATSEKWTDNRGNKQESTEWTKWVAWGKRAEILAKHVKKGDQIYLEGKKKTRSWEDNGQKKYAVEFIVENMKFLGGNKKQNGGGQSNDSGHESEGGDFNFQDFGPEPSFNQSEDIPF